MEVVNSTTVFAAIRYQTSAEIVNTDIFRGVFVEDLGDGEWVWDRWFACPASSEANCFISDLLHLPNTQKLIVAYNSAGVNGGIWAIDESQHNTGQPWLTIANYEQHKQRMVTYSQVLACDAQGEYLYVGSRGSYQLWDAGVRIGGVLRLNVPRVGAPQPNDWVAIMNGESTPTSADIYYEAPNGNFPHWEPTQPSISYRLTDVPAIAIDPVNPLHIYVGMGCGGNKFFHQNNGVWEYTPPADSEGEWTWSQVVGGPIEPQKRVTTLDISPADPSMLIIGTWGTEFFRTTISPSNTPSVAVSEPLHADQTLLLVRGSAANGTDPLASVVVDGTPLGLAAEFVLNDAGTPPDIAAADSIWTADLGSITVEPGVYALPVIARDGLGYTLRGTLDVTVISLPVWMKENSQATGELFTEKSGHPYSGNFFDSTHHGKLLVITAEYDDDNDGGQVFLNTNVIDGVPVFAEWEDESGMALGTDHRALAVGDYDRDGDVDLFVGSATPGESRLYRNDETTRFTDEIDLFLPEAIDTYDVLNASWVDVDQDGWLDLTCSSLELTPPVGVVTHVGDFVPTTGLVYNTSAFVHRNVGGFQFIPQELPTPWSFGHVWVDLDNDGDQDYVIANMVGYQNVVLINDTAQDSTYSLVDMTSQWLVGNLPLPGRAVTTLDYDRDGFMDVVFGTWDGENSDVILLRNTGTSFVIDTDANEALTALSWADFLCSGIAADDIDLNGWDDIVVLAEGDSRPRVFFNWGPTGDWFEEIEFSEFNKGAASGFAIADYNGDGDPDFYIGSEEGEPFFYRTLPAGYEGTNPDPAPENNWLKVALKAHQFAEPNTIESVIGAKVRLFMGTPDAQTKVVDGGQGRSGQKQSVLTFGLGELSQATQMQIVWPDGIQETRTGPFAANSTITVERDALTTSTKFTYVPYPDGGADWIFSWNTNYRSDKRFDRVLVEYDDCGTAATLTPDTPDVVHSFSRVGNVYKHSMRWNGKCCVPHKPNIYRFRVFSGLAAPASENAYTPPQLFGPAICMQQQ